MKTTSRCRWQQDDVETDFSVMHAIALIAGYHLALDSNREVALPPMYSEAKFCRIPLAYVTKTLLFQLPKRVNYV